MQDLTLQAEESQARLAHLRTLGYTVGRVAEIEAPARRNTSPVQIIRRVFARTIGTSRAPRLSRVRRSASSSSSPSSSSASSDEPEGLNLGPGTVEVGTHPPVLTRLDGAS